MFSKQAKRSSLRLVIDQVETAPPRLSGETGKSVWIHRLDQRFAPATIADLVKAYRSGTPTPALCKQYQLGKGRGLLHERMTCLTKRFQFDLPPVRAAVPGPRTR